MYVCVIHARDVTVMSSTVNSASKEVKTDERSEDFTSMFDACRPTFHHMIFPDEQNTGSH